MKAIEVIPMRNKNITIPMIKIGTLDFNLTAGLGGAVGPCSEGFELKDWFMFELFSSTHLVFHAG